MIDSVDLAKVQEVFSDELRLFGGASRQAFEHDLHFEKLIAENLRIPPDVALGIYRNNVAGGRAKALAVAYPACAQILGAECFEGFARRFSESTPARQPDLNLYGEGFADFVDERVTVLDGFSDYAYLGDLARLEWLCHVAYYADDVAPFDFVQLARFAGGAGESLRLELGDSVALLRSDYPVMTIREINLGNGDAQSVSSEDCPQFFVVWRDQFRACVERVDKNIFDLLTALEAGLTLGEIADQHPDAAAVLSEAVPRLIQRGWIAGIADRESPTETA